MQRGTRGLVLAAFLLLGIGSCLQPSSASASDRLHKAARRQPPIVTTAHHTYVDALFGIGYKDADGFLHWRRAGADPAGLLDSLQIWLLPGVPEDVKYQMLKQLDNPVIAADGMFHKGDTLGGLNSGGKIKGSKPKVYGMTIVEFDGPCLVYPPITFGNIEYTLKMGKDCGNFCYAFRIIPCPPTKTVTVTKYVEVPTPPPPPPPPPPARKPSRKEIRYWRLMPYEMAYNATLYGGARYEHERLPDLTGQRNFQDNYWLFGGGSVPITSQWHGCKRRPLHLEVAAEVQGVRLNTVKIVEGNINLGGVYDRRFTYGRLEVGVQQSRRESGYYGYTHIPEINPLDPPRNWVNETRFRSEFFSYTDMSRTHVAVIAARAQLLYGKYSQELEGEAEGDFGPFVLIAEHKHSDQYRQNISLGSGITAHVPDATFDFFQARAGVRPPFTFGRTRSPLAIGAGWELRDNAVYDQYGHQTYFYHRTGPMGWIDFNLGPFRSTVKVMHMEGDETYNHRVEKLGEINVSYNLGLK